MGISITFFERCPKLAKNVEIGPIERSIV